MTDKLKFRPSFFNDIFVMLNFNTKKYKKDLKRHIILLHCAIILKTENSKISNNTRIISRMLTDWGELLLFWVVGIRVPLFSNKLKFHPSFLEGILITKTQML
jgi:hypothetical protein